MQGGHAHSISRLTAAIDTFFELSPSMKIPVAIFHTQTQLQYRRFESKFIERQRTFLSCAPLKGYILLEYRGNTRLIYIPESKLIYLDVPAKKMTLN